MNIHFLRFVGKVKGIFSPTLPYMPLLQDGNSIPYFGTYSPQHMGNFDTDCCWDFSGVNILETRFRILWEKNLIPQDTKDWCIQNKYCDTNGMPDFSDRWVAIISGVKSAGNYQQNFWDIVGQVGMIPQSMLPYDPNQAYKYNNQNDFNNDYFNVNVITPAMRAMGKEFLKRFDIAGQTTNGGYYKDISSMLLTYLKEGSMQIGIPVPQDGSWNQVNVTCPAGNYNAQHAVELSNFDSTMAFPFQIYDSYMPNQKNLSQNYYIPFITRARVYPKPVTMPVPLVQFSPWMKTYFNVVAWLQGKTIPYPSTPIGGII